MKKAKYVVLTRKKFKNIMSVKTDAYTFEIVKELKYLGTYLTRKNERISCIIKGN